MSQIKSKKVSETLVETNHIVLPSHTNALGTIFGGVLMSWIDVTAAICAQRHAGQVVVTASIDVLHFLAPARVGDVVNLKARIIYTGSTSMVVRVDAIAENIRNKKSLRCVTADLSFVALDANSKPSPVPPIAPETPEERENFSHAAERRKMLLEDLKAIKSATESGA